MKDAQGVLEFVRVVEQGSFSAAAQLLGMSKAYVSQSVSKLEGRLGVRLLQRTTRKLSLTEAGEIYYRYAQEISRQLSEGEERVRDFQLSPRGRIRVSMVDGGLGEWYLAPVLASFAAQNPGVILDLDLSSRLVDLVGEGFDFAIRVGTLSDSSLLARRLTSFRFGLYASPDYLEREGIVSSPEQLRRHNCLTGATARWVFTLGGKTIEIRPIGSWHSKSGQVLISAAKEGLGIVRTANFYAQEALASGAVVEVLADWTREKTPVWIVCPSGRNIPRRVSCAINFLLDSFREKTPWADHTP
jgi:DNA-binding transcriptional LysR family regulator